MIVDPDFPDHWKTRMLVGALEDEVAPVYVLRLWAHCQNRRQFQFDNLSSEALKALCHYPGNANKLESSLVTSGFVRRDAKVLVVVGWDEYNSSLIASWENGKKGGRPPKKPMGSARETQRKPTGLREEKRREDLKRVEKSGEKTSASPAFQKRAVEVRGTLKTDSFCEWWRKWLDHVFQKTGQWPSEPSQETTLMELARRGHDKALADVQFSMRVNAKSIRDSDKDFEKLQQPGKASGGKSADSFFDEVTGT